MYLYTEYRGVHQVECTWSTGILWKCVRKCVRLYMEYKLMMIYDTESPQPGEGEGEGEEDGEKENKSLKIPSWVLDLFQGLSFSPSSMTYNSIYQCF